MVLTKFAKKDFENILEIYSIGKYKSHQYLFTGGNTVFRLITSEGKFILKIFEHAAMKFIETQNKLSDFLNERGVAIPRIVHTSLGKGILIYKKKKVVIQEFVEGKETETINSKIALDMGEKIGILDKLLLKYSSKGIRWQGKIHFEVMKGESLKKIDNMDFKEESLKVIKECNKLDRSKLRKCVMHGDICESNFLVKDNKLKAIIDWDDFQYNYLAFDVAVFVGHVLTEERRVRTDLIGIFFKEYQKYLKLNKEEIKAVYLFAKKRLLDGAVWSINLVSKHPEKKEEVYRWAKIAWIKYLNLDNLGLDKFQELVK
ncbi:MAG: phosphotransferase [Nanoarchaeota archaeon]|nr:phosphotransferase [Nanoarchaeota archaeon]